MARLNGKVAVVIGGFKGIDADIAERLAADAAVVIVIYARSTEDDAAVVNRIVAAGGPSLSRPMFPTK